jgi:cytochrome b pre-mRNA-processing protein 3
MPSTVSAPARPGWFARLIGQAPRERDRLAPLYEAVVAIARTPFWYREGQVPDTVTGRFDMLAAVAALVLVRLEQIDDEAARRDSVLLTEIFIADMDESLLEIGVGDYSVGKHVGRLVGALGGRLTAFREAVGSGEFLPAVRRNIFHEDPPSEDALELVTNRLHAFSDGLALLDRETIVAGALRL